MDRDTLVKIVQDRRAEYPNNNLSTVYLSPQDWDEWLASNHLNKKRTSCRMLGIPVPNGITVKLDKGIAYGTTWFSWD